LHGQGGGHLGREDVWGEERGGGGDGGGVERGGRSGGREDGGGIVQEIAARCRGRGGTREICVHKTITIFLISWYTWEKS
jgi:hypothetical protein